jgi:stearoyl-CoA desaturase (Delta-9 desaturase)
MGEGWHNNHHAYQTSVRQGFRWWQCDLTFYILLVLSWFGLVWDLQVPPKTVVRREHRLGRRVINKVAAELAASFPVDPVTDQALDALACKPGWLGRRAQMPAADMPSDAFRAGIGPAQIPTLDEVRRHARARLGQTPPDDEIALLVRQKLSEPVASRLIRTMAPASPNIQRRPLPCRRPGRTTGVIL